MRVDHIAIPASDVPASTRWYQQQFQAEVIYQDDSWAFLKVGGIKLALVRPDQHPGHIAFSVTPEELQQRAKETGTPIATHRDGTRGLYIRDPEGNSVEFICYHAPT
jgi:catechol 2,3-dioxygenase-like lactoylglutathione lyase family enzyme